jgi:O-antigen ligase
MINAVATFLLSLALLQPMHLLPWVSWHSEVLAFLALLLLASELCFQIFANRQRYLHVPRSMIAGAFLILVLVAQYSAGVITYFGDALVLFFYVSLCVIAVTVGAHKNSLTCLPVAMLLAALISTALALTQALGVWNDLTWIAGVTSSRRPGANLGQPNQFATLLLMGMASLAYLYESRRLGKTIGGLLLALLVLGLALTESRTGLLSLLLMAAWVLAYRRIVGLRTQPVAVGLTVAGLLGLLWVWPTFIAYFQAGGGVEGGVSVSMDTSAGTRLLVWPQLITAVLQRPWFGWGLREVSEAHNAVLHSYTSGEAFSYAHNIVLDLAVGMGIPLTVIAMLIVAVWTYRRVLAVKTLLAWYCLALILPMAVHSMLEFPFAYAYFLLPTMLAVGVLEKQLAPLKMIPVSRATAFGLIGGLTVLMVWSAVEYVQVEEDFRVARFEVLHIGYTPSDYQRPRIILLTQLDALLEGVRMVPEPRMGVERIEFSRRVAMRYPWTATQNRYALSLALNGNATEARRQIQVMRAMHGEATHRSIMGSWKELSETKYPQLKEFVTP